MKCNPLRWLLGLLPLAILWWIGILGTQARIEADLAERTAEVLERAGLPWAKTSFKGRDALLGGRAEEDSEKPRAAIEVAKVWGVRAFEDRTEVLELIKNYRWQAALGASDVKLEGYVPNEAARKAILTSIRSALPKHKVDDQMKLARGAPEQKVWLGGTNFALRQLASLRPGATAGLEAAGLVIQGEADSSRNYETVRTALTRSMPQGISLKTDGVSPPRVSPYTWVADRRGSQVELTGYVPNSGARAELTAALRRAIPGVSVADRLSYAAGAPAGWQAMAGAAIVKLGELKQGRAEARDSEFAISGLTETAEAAETVRRSLRAAIPSSFRITEQIRQDPAVIAAEEARKAAEAAARRAAEEAARKKAEEDARRAAEAAARSKAQEEANRQRPATDDGSSRRAAEEAAARERAAAAEAARRKAEEDARRAAEAAEARKLADAKRIQDEAAARRKEEEDKALARSAEAQRCQAQLTSASATGTIQFRRASADLERASHKTLDSLAQILKGCPGFRVEIEGHTDNEGVPARNQMWSDRRANAVRDYLVRAGVPEASLVAVGYGEARPKAPNDSPENMALNRRIEFSLKSK